MTKRNEKANARLAEAQAYVKQEYVKKYARPEKVQGYLGKILMNKAVHYVEVARDTTYSSFEIKKISKGNFRVKADGYIIGRRFKSITAAEEWCAVHTK